MSGTLVLCLALVVGFYGQPSSANLLLANSPLGLVLVSPFRPPLSLFLVASRVPVVAVNNERRHTATLFVRMALPMTKAARALAEDCRTHAMKIQSVPDANLSILALGFTEQNCCHFPKNLLNAHRSLKSTISLP